jgi:HAD superfamily hydrolase (TIGR01549 family)
MLCFHAPLTNPRKALDGDVTAGNKYQAIIFDVGSTLLEIVQDPNELAMQAIAHLGTMSATAYSAAIRRVAQEWRDAGGNPEVSDLPSTWVDHNLRALCLLGFAGDAPAAAQIIEETFLTAGLAVYPDVFDILSTLREQRYKLGIISNWPATLETTLQRSGLRDYFSVVVGSGNVGYSKPHPQIFKIAVERMEIDPCDALYVGDSMEHDVAGARGVGMDVVLLDRGDLWKAHEPRIVSLAQLPQLLEYNSAVKRES